MSYSFIQNLSQELATSATEEDFFASLVEYLAKALDVQYMYIGYLAEGGKSIKTIAFYSDGQLLPNQSFSLKNSPLEKVIQQPFCHYTDQVTSKFPFDEILSKLNIESLVGMPIFTLKGKPSGVMVGMDTKPFKNNELAENLFRILARRAEHEMEQVVRNDLEASLCQEHQSHNAVELLLEAQKAMATENKIENIVHRLAQAAVKITGADYGAFFFSPNCETEGEPVHVAIGNAAYADTDFVDLKKTKIICENFFNYSSSYFSDVTQQPDFKILAGHLGISDSYPPVRTYLALPIVAGNTKKVLGRFILCHAETEFFKEGSVSMVEALVAQAAVCIEYARLSEEKSNKAAPVQHVDDKFRRIADAMPVMVWVTNQESQCTYLNTKWFEYTGQTEAEGLGYGWLQVIHPDDFDHILEIFSESHQMLKPFQFEYRLLGKDGQYRWMEDSGYPKYDQNNGFDGYVGAVVDIHERKLADLAVKESEENIRSMADTVPVMIWITRPNGNCIYLNKQWYDYTGQAENSALGQNWIEALHPDDRKVTYEKFISANEKRQPLSLEYRLRGKDKNYRWMLVSGCPKFDSAGKYEGFIGSVVDIHERKIAEDALDDQKQLYENIFNSTSDGIIIFDFEGNIQEVNPVAHIMHGYSYQEFTAMKIQHLMGEADSKKFCGFLKTLSEGKNFLVSTQHIKKDKSLIDVDLTGISFTYNGEVQLMTVIRDITSQKKAQQALKNKEQTLRMALEATNLGTFDMNPQTGDLIWSARCKELFGLRVDETVDYSKFLMCLHPDDRQSVDDVVQWAFNPESKGKYEIEYRVIDQTSGVHRWIKATGKVYFNEEKEPVRFIGTVLDISEEKRKKQELEEKTRELEFANEDLRNFTYTISHDIKNPLSNLVMVSAIAQDFTTIEEFQQIMEVIDKSAYKINHILEGLLKVIREERTAKKVELLEIADILEEAKTEVSDDMRASGGEIVSHIQVKEIYYVRSYLQSILRNLISNALKYRKPDQNPKILITVQEAGNFTEIKVTDNGLGIDLNRHQKNMFQPFKRFNKNVPGTGIGLFMIKRMIEKYGGTITVESEPDHGTTFTIQLVSLNFPHNHPTSIANSN